MDQAVQLAAEGNLPVRVIVLDGDMRDRNDPNAKASCVNARLLDPVSWRVTSYETNTGACTITRGAIASKFADQFSVREDVDAIPEKKTTAASIYVRNPEVRVRVLDRASGECEWCAAPGFAMSDGRIFLETHHIVPLHEGGSDSVKNVAALCANHHREAHYGAKAKEIRAGLLDRIQKKLKSDGKGSS